jgi:hypothetical protein
MNPFRMVLMLILSWVDVVRGWGMDIDEALEYVRLHHHAVLATLKKDGSPQLSQVTAGADDEGRVIISTRDPAYKVLTRIANTRTSRLVTLLPLGRVLLPGRGTGGAGCRRRAGVPGVGPVDHRREAGAGESSRVRCPCPARAAGGCVAAWSGLPGTVLALAEVVDDAAGCGHPVGAAGRGVPHDPAGERGGSPVQSPGGPPGAAVPVPGPFQVAGEEVGGAGDRERGPGGQGAGEAADPDVLPDLGPVVAGCVPDGGDQVAGGAADGDGPLPSGGVAVPAGAGMGLGGGLVQRAGDGRAGLVRRTASAAAAVTMSRNLSYCAPAGSRSRAPPASARASA